MLVFCSYPPFVSVQGRLVRLKEGNDIDNGIHRYVHIALHIYKVTFHHCHSWQTKHYNHFIVEWHWSGQQGEKGKEFIAIDGERRKLRGKRPGTGVISVVF